MNLVVGTNNSGKSSLLEAIYLLTSKQPSSSLLYILSERGEYMYKPSDPRYGKKMSGGYLVSHIFNGHHLNKDSVIVITGQSESPSSLSITIKNGRLSEDEGPQLPLIEHEEFEEIEPASQSMRLSFELARAHDQILADHIFLSGDYVSFHQYPRRISPPEQASRLVTTEYLTYDALSALWDSITLTPREENVISALQLVEPNLERISFTSRQNSSSGILLKFRDEQEPIPLSSMGDGMRRVLAIIASLVSVDSGVLLVDEIDTGLYYQMLKDMWLLIFETALKGNSQVFATTHSWDCVRAFQEAIQNFSQNDIGRLIRLERANEYINAVEYSADELDIALRQGIEVR
ncbi:MAG: ATP-binding protein [bacterium]|nr:ATP-binding protein [bacterium]